MSGFRQGLAEADLVEGETVTLVERYADGHTSRLPALVDELIDAGTTVFLTPGHAATRPIRARTTVPVVAVGMQYSPQLSDLYQSVGRPGGSVTGFFLGTGELWAKRAQLLEAAVPAIVAVAVMHNSTDPIWNGIGLEAEAAVKTQGKRALRLELNRPDADAVHQLIGMARAEGMQGLIVVRDFMTSPMGMAIATAAIDAGIATISERREFRSAGELLAYGADLPDLYRRGAATVAKILSGADPAELPIQLPTKFNFAVNEVTARALGLTLPPDLLVQATEVIE